MQIANSWDMFGILNAQGTPWTPRVFDTEREAKAYLDECRRGWPVKNEGDPLPRHRVVPVSVTVSRTQAELKASRNRRRK
jgi:hypothetical protein